MKSSDRSVRLAVVVCILVLAIQPGCADKPSVPRQRHDHQTEQPPVSWNSSRMREIETKWTSLEQMPSKTKDDYEKKVNAMDRLLARSLSNRDVKHLAATAEELPLAANERSDFENAVLSFAVALLVELGDREHLVMLLSTRCPDHVYPEQAIEYYLPAQGYKLKDPILVLGEAYAKSRIPEVRRILASAVRRGFAALGIHGKDDEDFVTSAMRWYEKEKDTLVLNCRYTGNEVMVPLEAYERHPEFYEKFPAGLKREPLFLRKPQGK